MRKKLPPRLNGGKPRSNEITTCFCCNIRRKCKNPMQTTCSRSLAGCIYINDIPCVYESVFFHFLLLSRCSLHGNDDSADINVNRKRTQKHNPSTFFISRILAIPKRFQKNVKNDQLRVLHNFASLETELIQKSRKRANALTSLVKSIHN